MWQITTWACLCGRSWCALHLSMSENDVLPVGVGPRQIPWSQVVAIVSPCFAVVAPVFEVEKNKNVRTMIRSFKNIIRQIKYKSIKRFAERVSCLPVQSWRPDLVMPSFDYWGIEDARRVQLLCYLSKFLVSVSVSVVSSRVTGKFMWNCARCRIKTIQFALLRRFLQRNKM